VGAGDLAGGDALQVFPAQGGRRLAAFAMELSRVPAELLRQLGPGALLRGGQLLKQGSGLLQ
jgi:hypothetical protein